MREIGRELGIPMGTLEYHLHYLVKAELLTTRQDPRYTRYFPSGGMSRHEKDVLAVLRQKVPRQIAAHLLLEPGPASHGQLLTKFDLSGSTLSFHLKELTHAGLARSRQEGRYVYYSANFQRMKSLLGYLSENCCARDGAGADCAPGCGPGNAAAGRARRDASTT